MALLQHRLRRGLAAWSACAVGLGLIAALAPAHAEAPQQKTQAPGYYRMMLGDFEVTALFDGVLDMSPKDLLTNTTPAQVSKLLSRSFKGETVAASDNGYLINTGSKLVLVDTGAAGLFGPTLGQLLGNLKASGYQPEQVDEIVITHLHADHIGGLVADGQRVFPNATVHVDVHDANFWLNPESLEKAPKEMKGFFQSAQNALKPYIEADRFKPFDGNTELMPGLRAIASYGHTPGHTVYAVESQGKKLMLWGDLMHVAAVQFPQPSVTISFDTDSKAAAAQRKKIYADAAKAGYLIGGAHLPFPGLGRLRAEGAGGYAWVPIDYDIVR